MVRELKRLMEERPGDFAERYSALALCACGLEWPQSRYRQPDEWRGVLGDTLGLKTKLIRRRPR